MWIRSLVRPSHQVNRVSAILFTSVLLASCGSGGGSGDGVAPDAPVLSLTPYGIKNFSFSWADVSGETEYRLLENPDGSSGYTQVARVGANATSLDLEVFIPGRINASYILSACNRSGCSDSNTVIVSGTLAEAAGYIKASNTGRDSRFGFSVSLSGDGNTLAVGAPFENSNATGIGGDQQSNAAIDSGAVYVFARNGTTWSQQAYVKASNTGARYWFGWSVALSANGDTLAVGSRFEASNANGVDGDQGNNAAINSGAVYVFTRSGTTWSQQAYVKASNTDGDDQFGYSIALSANGNTLAVAAIGEASNATGINGDQSNNTASGSGAVYVFTRSARVWSQQAYVKASNTRMFDEFGSSIALADDGNTLAVGAIGESSNATGINGDQTNNTANISGAVYVFTRSGTTWSQQAYVKASNTDADDQFGFNVALAANGNVLAVGAAGEASNATGINGDQSNNSAIGSGAVYVFTRSGSTWLQQAYVKASNAEAGDLFGWSMALTTDGNTLAVGAVGESSNATGINGDQTNNTANISGAVYVFTRSSSTWLQQAYVKASNTGASDGFGFNIALAADGSTLAAGAVGESSNATGIGGNQTDNSTRSSGAVYLY